jgi:hypothetical protein
MVAHANSNMFDLFILFFGTQILLWVVGCYGHGKGEHDGATAMVKRAL